MVQIQMRREKRGNGRVLQHGVMREVKKGDPRTNDLAYLTRECECRNVVFKGLFSERVKEGLVSISKSLGCDVV